MTSVGHSWPTFEIGMHREDGQKCPSCVEWLATFWVDEDFVAGLGSGLLSLSGFQVFERSQVIVDADFVEHAA